MKPFTVELEDKESETEHDQSHTTKGDDKVSPAHVAGDRAACCAFGEIWISTIRQLDVTSVPSSCTVGEPRGSDDTDRLPHGQQRHEESTVLGQKLEGDQGVDGNVSTETK